MTQTPTLYSTLAEITVSAGQIESTDSAAQPKFKQIRFDDYFWDDVVDFLREHASLNQNLLLPDELCDAFPVTSSYHQSHTEKINHFDWVLLHKGRLFNLSLKVLRDICRSFTPVFANEVFVLFTRPQISRSLAIAQVRRSPHLQALLLKVRDQKIKQSLDNLSIAKPARDKRLSKTKRKSTLLIEQEIVQSGWFNQKPPVSFVPLSWAATTSSHPCANLGDALSPILVSALSGLPIVHRDFESWQRRLACVGTIAHGFRHGAVHFWGTGIDHKKSPTEQGLADYQKPAKTNFHVHAVRGAFTAQVLKSQAIKVPLVYGDPVWFLPSIIQPAAEKQYELGIVVHLSELAERSLSASVNASILRYQIPKSLQKNIRIITTLTEPSFAALEERVQEITSCKRIVSTSLHGLVISETYGIPCVSLRMVGQGASFARLEDDRERIDWRIRDFYSGVGIEKLFVYGQKRHKMTDWDDLINAIDRYWSPLSWSPEQFLEAFPLPLAFNPLQGESFANRSLLEQIRL